MNIRYYWWFVIAFLFILPSSLIIGQETIAIVKSIDIKSVGNDRDVIVITGSNFNLADDIIIEPIKHQFGTENDYQWIIIIPNADVDRIYRQRLESISGVFIGDNTNVLEKYKIEVSAIKHLGVLKSAVIVKSKINNIFYVNNPRLVIPSEDVAENQLKEILFQRGNVENDVQFLTDKSSQQSIVVEQQELGVPVLRVNIVGVDGAKTVKNSKATQLSIFLNEHRREEISQKFGIQFFVNNISVDNNVVLDKTTIYYRYEKENPNLRFLKEALYLAKIIPSESIIKPLIDQQNKSGVDIEIYVGKNLR